MARAKKSKGKRSRVPGTFGGNPLGPGAESDQTALHEAAHIVAAHALGRRPIYARITPRRTAAGVSLGYADYEPDLSEEVRSRQESGLPFTHEQVDWLLQGVVIAYAGAFAEYVDSASYVSPESAESDRQQIGEIASLLGQVVEDASGLQMVDPAFQQAIHHVAREITRDRLPDFESVKNALLDHGELDEVQLRESLEAHGATLGSHARLLVGLHA